MKWTVDIRRDADIVNHHRQYQFRQSSCHLAFIPYHSNTIPSHLIPDELYVDCIDFFAPCKRNWTSTRESHQFPVHCKCTVPSPGRPMPGSRGWEGACACYICTYVCTYVHIICTYNPYILHSAIYPMTFFFSIWPPLHLKISPKTIVCIHQALPTFPISPGCPTVIYQKQHSRPPLRHLLLKSQRSDPRSKFEHGIKMTVWYVRLIWWFGPLICIVWTLRTVWWCIMRVLELRGKSQQEVFSQFDSDWFQRFW